MFSSKITYVWVCSLVLLACSNFPAKDARVGQASTPSPDANALSAVAQSNDLRDIYVQSIAAYIKAVNKEYHITFDTLFFGKHVYRQPDDFPDIDLPKSIENTPIVLISPEAGLQKQKERKSLFYINLIGAVDAETAEFIFITFSNGCEHQFDAFINFKFDKNIKGFVLEEPRFENFLYKKQ